MRPNTLSSTDYFSLSGFNYSSHSPKSIPLNHKGFGHYFNSPKSESTNTKNLTYTTKLKNESNRLSHKANMDLDNSFEKRTAKTRDYSANRAPSSLTYSGLYDNRDYEDKRSSDLYKPTSTYSQTATNFRTGSNPLSKSTYIRDATREDANILTRKKYEVELNAATSIRRPSDMKPSTTKNYENNDRWEDGTPKKGTVTYYPLEDFISRYSPNRNIGTANGPSYRYSPEKEKTEIPARPLSQSRVMASTSTAKPPTGMKSSSIYESSIGTPYTTASSSVKQNSFFDREADSDIDTNLRSTATSNFLAQYNIKKYDYKDIYDTPSSRSIRNESTTNYMRSSIKNNDNDTYKNDTYKRDNEYTSSYLARSHYDKDRTSYSLSTNPQTQPEPEKSGLNSYITRVDRGATGFSKKFDENEDYKSKFLGSRTFTGPQSEEKSYLNNRESPFKASHSILNRDSKFYKTPEKSSNEPEYTYSGELSKWGAKASRTSARLDESTDGSQEEDSPVQTSGYTYYQTGLAKNLNKYDPRDAFSSIYREHFQQSFQAMKFCRYMVPPDARALAKKKVYLPKKESHKNRKTLIFDLDETLIHCVDNPMKRSDVKLSIKFPTGEVIEAGINVRPYALECLKEMSQIFEVMVFTASHKSYANVVLDYLDPHKQYITHRLYRDSCIYTEEGVYVKDLRVIGNRNLQDMILVDNAAYSFGFQIENGVPCIPFYEDKSDEELKHIIPYLKKLNQARDIREVNKKTFKFAEYARYQTPEEVMKHVILRD